MADPVQVEEEKNTSGFLETAPVLSQAVETKVVEEVEAEIAEPIADADVARAEAEPQSRHSHDDRTQSIESIVQNVTIDNRLSSQEDSQRPKEVLMEEQAQEQAYDQNADDDEENSYIEPSYDDIDQSDDEDEVVKDDYSD